MHSEIDLAYTAGLLDGEGCISLGKVKDKISRFGHQYRLSVRIANSDRGMIQYLKDTFGGYKRKIERENGYKDSWVWALQEKEDVKSFLKEILPYVKTKKKQIEIALKSFKFRKGKGHYKTKEEEESLTTLYNMMRKLNGGGDKHTF